MNVVDVINVLYPGAIQARLIDLGQDASGVIFITKWIVPDVPQPTIDELQAQIPELLQEFEYEKFVSQGIPLISIYCDSVAKEKKFDTALSCASYVSSTVDEWRNQTLVFVSWRDAVFSYLIQQLPLMKSGQRSIPTFQEFKSELPVIEWP